MSRLTLLKGLCATAFASLALASPAAADFTVNDLDDVAVAGADGVCDAPGGENCTLREAIQEANNTAGLDTITFSVNGTINTGTQGTLTTIQPVTIDGNGPLNTVVDGTDNVRLFFVNGAAATFKDMRLEDGGLVEAGSDGGGAIRATANATLDNATVTGSQITGTGSGRGAGIYMLGGTLDLLNGSAVTDNVVSTSGMSAMLGGGISAEGPVNVTDSTVSGNQTVPAGGAGGVGGGIYADGEFSLTRSTLSGNTSDSQGGGLFNSAGLGPRQIVNSTISGNTSFAFAGGMLISNSSTITDSTFADNTLTAGTPTGRDVQQTTGTTTVQNTILASSGACDGSIVSAAAGHNIDSGTSCGFGTMNGNQENVSPAALGLGPLAGNGGPTMTRAIGPGSAALNAADPTCGGLATDQRGVMRPQGTACDVGAYEFVFPPAGGGGGTTGTPVTPITPGVTPTQAKRCPKGRKLKKGKCVKKKKRK
jgi:CSLREA domain-containing protein